MVVTRKRIILTAIAIYSLTMLPSCRRSLEDYFPQRVTKRLANMTPLSDVECFDIGDNYFILKANDNDKTLMFRCSNCLCPKRNWSDFNRPDSKTPSTPLHPDNHEIDR